MDLLEEILLSVSHAGLQLESLQLEDVVGVWTNLWHQAGVGVRMGKVTKSRICIQQTVLTSFEFHRHPVKGLTPHVFHVAGNTSAMDGEQQMDA